MADSAPGGWQKLDILGRFAGAILLPIAIWFATTLYTSHQKEAELAQRNADRVASLLNHLASNNPKERKLSLEVLVYLSENNQMPDELLIPLMSTANDEDKDIASAGLAALKQVASHPEKATSIVKAAGSNTNTEELIVKTAKSDPTFKDSIISATESLKNDPKAALSSLRIRAQLTKQD